MKIDINIKTNNDIEDITGEHELNITTISAIEEGRRILADSSTLKYSCIEGL